MPKPYRVRVFGKSGCEKCGVLQQRLDKLLAKPEWQDVEKEYCNVETEEGLVAFSEAECLNPQRIPAVLLMRHDGASDRYEPVPNPHPGRVEPPCGKSGLYQHVGLQTDYSAEGKGVISPRMLTAVLSRAQQ